MIYDCAFDGYLAAYTVGTRNGIVFRIRFSRDRIHWSGPMGPDISDPGRDVFYPTLIGETGDPTIGGAAPRRDSISPVPPGNTLVRKGRS